MDQPYIYHPFSVPSMTPTRLIKILLEKRAGKFVCILYHFKQAEAPPYCALPYLWGDFALVGAIYFGNDDTDIHLHPLHANMLRFLGCMWEQKIFTKHVT